jgi:hypothetical protein
LSEALADLVDRFAGDASARAELAERSRMLYAERFAIEHTIATMRRRISAAV